MDFLFEKRKQQKHGGKASNCEGCDATCKMTSAKALGTKGTTRQIQTPKLIQNKQYFFRENRFFWAKAFRNLLSSTSYNQAPEIEIMAILVNRQLITYT